jgi:eukaryotic-like serine/threonine-protein kinase
MPDVQPNHNYLKSNTFTVESDSEILPRTFDRYLLLKRIARGGMGEVFLATPAGTIDGAERPCVLKVIRREHTEDSSFLARFLDEARIQSQLEHPGVVRVLEAAMDSSDKPFCVFEHVEGRNLSEVRLRAQQLGVTVSWPDAIAIAMTLCEGLAHVHERTDAFGQPLEIVHRDLSPQNVMIAYGGDVKLIDFGTARGQNRRCHTIAGIVFAKPGYVAPEVANNNPGGIPADIYAVGIMLWELLSGRRFLTGETSEHLAAVAAGTRVPCPIAESVQAPPELDVILQRMTATAMEDRYGSASEAMQDFAQILKRAPSTSDGQRSVRVRISQLMHRLYPAEPTRTRSEFQRLIASAKQTLVPASALALPPSPEPPTIESPVDPDLLGGTRYRLLGELGRGASGCVHEALHLDLGRRVALKILSKEAASDNAGFERFRREASTVAQLEHENIVTLYDFGKTDDDRAYFAMERLRGETLDQLLLKSGSLEWRSALNLTIQACQALSAAHQAGVVHRDIKPANLFLARNGVLKLLDFGVAHLRLQPDLVSSDSEAFVLIGTPEYMAPEQAKGVEPSSSSDVYALASVLYELLTGERPFAADSIPVLIEAKSTQPLVSVRKRELGRAVPKSVDRILCEALSPKPEHRYSSAEAFRVVLQHALEASALTTKRRSQRVTRLATQLSLLGLVSAGALYASPELRHKSASLYDWTLTHAQVSATAPVLRKSTAAVKDYSGRLLASLRQLRGAAAEAQVQTAPQTEMPQPVEQPEAVARADNSTERPGTTAKGPAPVLDNGGPANELDRVSHWLENGQPSRALRAARRLGNQYPENASILAVWEQAALQTKAYGEARSVAEQRVRFDSGQDALLSLARLQKSTGQSERAKVTLQRLLKNFPDCEEAKTQLERIEVKPRVATR